MRNGRFPGRAGRKAAAAFLVVAMAVPVAGCGMKEEASRQGTSLPGQENPIPRGSAATGGGEIATPAGAGITVIVAPLSPSRIAPPSVSVKSPPGRGAEVASVRWIVNGVEQGSEPILAPSLFRRGDRIQAIVNLRSGGKESFLTTPEVVAVNALPAVADVRIEPQAIITGSTVRAVVQARDPDGDPLTFKYQWYVDNRPDPAGGDSTTLHGVKKGSWVHVTVTPNDGFADGAWKSSPRHQVVNALPVVKSALPKEVPPDRKFVYRIEAEDPDGDPLTYKLMKAPPGMSLTGSTLEWQVPDEYIGKLVEAVVEISDGDGGQTVQNIMMAVQGK